MAQVLESWAYFDFDDTLAKGDSILVWRKFLYQKKPWLRFFQILDCVAIGLNALRLIKVATLKRIFFIPAAYLKPTERDSLAQEFVAQELVPRFYPDVVDLVFAHYKLGHQVVIISASSVFYLEKLAKYFPPCKIIGTQWEFPSTGLVRIPQYAPFLDSPQGPKANSLRGNLKGKNKVKYIQAHPDLPASGTYSFAYSDNIVDKFLLEFSEFPTAVGPNPALRNLAMQKQWPILEVGKNAQNLRVTLTKLFHLFFLWPGSAPKSSPVYLPDDPRWNPHQIPYDWFATIKARVSAHYSEHTHPEIHQHIFKGFPLLTELKDPLLPVLGEPTSVTHTHFEFKENHWTLAQD